MVIKGGRKDKMGIKGGRKDKKVKNPCSKDIQHQWIMNGKF